MSTPTIATGQTGIASEHEASGATLAACESPPPGQTVEPCLDHIIVEVVTGEAVAAIVLYSVIGAAVVAVIAWVVVRAVRRRWPPRQPGAGA